MARRNVKLTANFERNLEAIEAFFEEAQAPQVFDALLAELTDTVVPNLERFPDMGRALLERPVRSVEAANAAARLRAQLAALGEGASVREYVLSEFLMLYAVTPEGVFLLSIRHHRQLSFDFDGLWGR